MLHRQSLVPGCKPHWMMAAFLASALFASPASAQVAVDLVLSDPEPKAPITLTVTASTPIDEPILDYQWRGLGVAPRCRARDCTIDFPVASCRRVEVAVTDRFGRVTVVDEQICASEDGATPPRATINLMPGDPPRVEGQFQEGAATVTLTRLWIDDEEVLGTGADLPEAEGCHVVDLLVADSEGHIGLDQRFVCSDDEAPRIAVGADPSFCPRASETLRACAEVIDPLGRGVEAIGGEPVPLDGCAGLIASRQVDRIVVRGESGAGVIAGSMIACTAPSSGRPNLLFARLPALVSVTRGGVSTVLLSIDGGEPPYQLDGRLIGSSTIGFSRSAIVESTLLLELSAPGSGDWERLEVEISDARGLLASANASVSTADPLPNNLDPMQGAQAALSCQSLSGASGGAWLLLLLGAIPSLRRRR